MWYPSPENHEALRHKRVRLASRNQGSGQMFLVLHVPHVCSNNRHSAHLCRGPEAAVVSEVTASAEVTAAVVQVAEVDALLR